MKFDIGVPNSMHVKAMTQPWEHELTAAEVGEAMRLADTLGYWKVLLGEHFVVPAEHIELSGDHYLHPATTLAFVAGQTSNVKLGSSVTLLPMQPPMVHAKLWATLDWLSGGRAAPIIGVGWLEEEYQIFGVPFHERGRICDEYLAAMVELWTKDIATFEGRYVSFKNVGAAPKPLQKPYIPLWFGGDADAMLRRVARYGSGWSPWRTPPDKFPERLDFIRDQPGYHGQPIEVMYALSMLGVGAHHEVIDNPDAVGSRNPQIVIDQCGWLAELGVTETVLPPPPMRGFQDYLEWLQWVAEDIMPKVSD